MIKILDRTKTVQRAFRFEEASSLIRRRALETKAAEHKTPAICNKKTLKNKTVNINICKFVLGIFLLLYVCSTCHILLAWLAQGGKKQSNKHTKILKKKEVNKQTNLLEKAIQSERLMSNIRGWWLFR